MANSRMTLSAAGTERLDKVMAELPLLEDRPETLRVAFAKGIAEATGEPPEGSGGGWVIPAGVIAKDNEYLLYKHLMIDKIGFPLEDKKQLDSYLVRFIELGLKVMEEEIKSLSNMDNYLLYLVERAK